MREKRKPKRHPESEWCEVSRKPIGEGDKRPSRIRCPECRRLLVPQTINCEPFGRDFEPLYVIPRHKIPHGKR